MSDTYNVTVMESSILTSDVHFLLFIFQSHFDLRWEVYRGHQSCQLVRAWPRSNRTQHNQNLKSWTLVELWESRWFSENWLPRPGCAHLVWQDWPHTAYLHCAPCSGAGLTCGSPPGSRAALLACTLVGHLELSTHGKRVPHGSDYLLPTCFASWALHTLNCLVKTVSLLPITTLAPGEGCLWLTFKSTSLPTFLCGDLLGHFRSCPGFLGLTV